MMNDNPMVSKISRIGGTSVALPSGGAQPASKKWRSAGIPWLYLMPALILLLAMTIGPAIYILHTSLRNVNILGGEAEFVGFQNFESAITNPSTRQAFILTVLFVIVVVTLQMALGLALALPLARQSLATRVAATLMLLPFAVTPAVSAMIFRQLVNPNYGWIPHYLEVLGAPPNIDLLGNPATAWLVLIVVDVWQWTPFVALILMAGLNSLPLEPREAALVDGANSWQIFRFITLPGLIPFLAIAVVLRTIQAFKTFDSFKILTGGGPGNSTEIINLGIYRVGLQTFNIGLASAMAVLLLVFLLTIVPAMLKVIGRLADPEDM
jgi:multiple sugar transport system permease protein